MLGFSVTNVFYWLTAESFIKSFSVSISTGISIVNLLAMLVIYDRDPIEPPNNAERKRSSMITEIILPEICNHISVNIEIVVY